MKILFVVQGQGRGHVTQAIALHRILCDAGHEIVEVLVGGAASGPLPSFVSDAFGTTPILRYESPALIMDGQSRAIDWFETLRSSGRLATRYVESIERIAVAIERTAPDVIVNFFEPLVGLLHMRRGVTVPTVAIAHQHMFFHPRYPFPASARIERRAMTWFTSVCSFGASRRLGLSLYPAEDVPRRRLGVVPPLLRSNVLSSRSTPGPHYLVYLWRPELLNEIEDMSRRRPDLQMYCFTDVSQEFADCRSNGSNLIVHPLSQTRFVEVMAGSAGVASTAGFESTSEAMYLGKPLLMVPTHLEQRCNALDAVLIGAGTRSRKFDLARLDAFASNYRFDTLAFRDWVDGGPEMFVREIEQAADRVVEGVHFPVSQARRRKTGSALRIELGI
ncbi:MAG: hypothetical protein KDD65_10685 [Bacteroidetes bacterium]|nr:hypothetical protein [Bacteroidota bacterium]